ncbi:alpha/beta hydrolase [Hirschia maritima]|uniref:alpha/beta hydrolase n=1 Tax=Hirschia maritima TaxID=1121961 RepID=UPI0003A19AB5|nr:alpha/beta hydrolase [Hirschia maritima]
MKHLIASLLCSLGMLFPLSMHSEEPTQTGKSETFVIVHGSTGGGWDWKTVAGKLEAKGHTVYRPTLSGLGERMHLPAEYIDLNTHVEDIVNTIIFEELDNVILAGHSYGGAVITGVMDRIPERIKHVIFLDAMVLEDGMSVLDLNFDWMQSLEIRDHQILFNWLNPEGHYPKDVPHPHKTYTSPVSYKNPNAKKLSVSFVAFIPEGMTKEARAADASWHRAEQRGWTIRTLPGHHTIYRERPDEFIEMLISCIGDKNKPTRNNQQGPPQ